MEILELGKGQSNVPLFISPSFKFFTLQSMKDLRMSDLSGNISEEHMAKMFPDLTPEEQREAAENYSDYLHVVAQIDDDLTDKGELKQVQLRFQYEKRNRKFDASQNDSVENDGLETPIHESY